MQKPGVGQATPTSVLDGEPSALGVFWTTHFAPFHLSASVERVPPLLMW